MRPVQQVGERAPHMALRPRFAFDLVRRRTHRREHSFQGRPSPTRTRGGCRTFAAAESRQAVACPFVRRAPRVGREVQRHRGTAARPQWRALHVTRYHLARETAETVHAKPDA